MISSRGTSPNVHVLGFDNYIAMEKPFTPICMSCGVLAGSPSLNFALSRASSVLKIECVGQQYSAEREGLELPFSNVSIAIAVNSPRVGVTQRPSGSSTILAFLINPSAPSTNTGSQA